MEAEDTLVLALSASRQTRAIAHGKPQQRSLQSLEPRIRFASLAVVKLPRRIRKAASLEEAADVTLSTIAICERFL